MKAVVYTIIAGGLLVGLLLLIPRDRSGEEPPKVGAEVVINKTNEIRYSKFSEHQRLNLPKFTNRQPLRSNLDSRIVRYDDQSVDYVLAVKMSRDINKQSSALADLQLISGILSSYQAIYKENPVGSENVEITAQLLGLNPKRVVFIDPLNAPVSSEGELVDRWGNPFYFHSLTSKDMDIRSRGEDGELWTNDDLSLEMGVLKLNSE